MMTIKEFFRKYAADQTRLAELQYQLKALDSPQVAITRANQVKVQGGKGLKQEDKIIKHDRKREQLEYEIAMLEFEVAHTENALRVVGDDRLYSVRILKRRYLQCHSINKIANDLGVSPSKVKKTLKETEEMLLYLIK